MTAITITDRRPDQSKPVNFSDRMLSRFEKALSENWGIALVAGVAAVATHVGIDSSSITPQLIADAAPLFMPIAAALHGKPVTGALAGAAIVAMGYHADGVDPGTMSGFTSHPFLGEVFTGVLGAAFSAGVMGGNAEPETVKPSAAAATPKVAAQKHGL